MHRARAAVNVLGPLGQQNFGAWLLKGNQKSKVISLSLSSSLTQSHTTSSSQHNLVSLISILLINWLPIADGYGHNQCPPSGKPIWLIYRVSECCIYDLFCFLAANKWIACRFIGKIVQFSRRWTILEWIQLRLCWGDVQLVAEGSRIGACCKLTSLVRFRWPGLIYFSVLEFLQE